MSDFFTKNSESVSATDNGDNYVQRHHDTRYDKKIITVTSAENAPSYKIKQWPTLSDEAIEGTNALGLSLDHIERRRASIERQVKSIQQAHEKQMIEEARAILDEEENTPLESSEESSMSSITVEELDRIRADACEEGRKQGYDEGFAQGLEEGTKQGQEQGFEQGFAEGSQKGYDQGVLQGSEDGFVKGHNEGLESGQRIVVEQAERFRFLADCLANPLREIDRQVTDELAYMVSRLVKVITHREIRQNADFLIKSVEKAVSVLPEATRGASVFMNAEDLGVVVSSIGNDYIRSQGWDLKEDPSLAPGDIRVSNSSSEVNFRVDDRIDALLEDFLTSVYPAVDSASRESIEGCPEYDEAPKPVIAPRNLSDIAQSAMPVADAEPEIIQEQMQPLEQENSEQDLQMPQDPGAV